MSNETRNQMFSRLDTNTKHNAVTVKPFPSIKRRDFNFARINAIFSNALEEFGDPNRLEKGWKSVSKSAMQLMGFQRRPMDFTLSNWKPLQGDSLAIMVSVPPAENFIDSLNLAFRGNFCKDSLVQVTCEDERFPAYPSSGCPNTWRTLIRLTPLDTSGQRSLTVDVNDGRHKSFHGVIEVVEKEYPTDSVWLSGNKSGIHATQKELDAVKVLVSNRTAKRYWDGPFRLPLHGQVTTEYGLKQYYNGVFLSGKGMVVQTGDPLGTVGDTGLATGPHLHWGLYVHGKAVNQNQWMREQSWMQ